MASSLREKASMRHALVSFLVVISDDQMGSKAVVLVIKGARSVSSLL